MLIVSLIVVGVVLITAASGLSRILSRPNVALGVRPPSRLSFVLVGVRFIAVGVASFLRWI